MSFRDNFYVCTDADGNMPALRRSAPMRRHFVQYVQNRPVRVCAYPGQDRVWNYAESRMEGLREGVVGYAGGPILPVTAAKVEEVK